MPKYGSDGIIGFRYGNIDYYYRKNIQGDVTSIFTSSGAKVASYVYDAWGNHKIYDANGNEVTSTSHIGYINPIRYRGYYFDVETGLYYVSSRYYDPEIGRFINADTIEYLESESINGVNLYTYCENDPVNKYDPSGHIAISAIFAIIIGVGSLAATANDIYQIKKNVDVDIDKTNSENVHIKESYKLLTPWTRFGYSLYLNHINPNTKDVIKGSTAGVQFEWELHNYAAWLGIGGESAKHLDIGKTIFADGKYHPLKNIDGSISSTGVMSIAMRAMFAHNLPCWIWDLIVNGGV